MKILFLTSGGDIGGAKTHIISLAARLNKNNNIKIVAFRQGGFADSSAQCNIDTAIIHSGNIFFDIKKLITVFDEFSPDIVHCHGAKANMMGILLKIFRKCPTITTMHSDYKKDYMHSAAKRMTFGVINSIALRCMDNYITVSESFTDEMIRRGFEPYKIFQICNGLDFNAENHFRTRQEYLNSLNFNCSDNDVICAFAARLTAVKDAETLLRGFAAAHEKVHCLKLIIAGDGEEKSKLQRLAKELRVEKSVCFAGWLKGADELFHISDICVLSSVSEGFPYSIVEGARAKCAVVSTNVGGIPSLIEHEKTGMLFAPKDFSALSDALTRLALNKDFREKLGNAVFEKAKQSFSLEKMCDIQCDIYRSVLKRYEYKNQRKNVIICGAYGRGNAGDDAIQKAISAQMKEIDSDMRVTIMSRRPKQARLSECVSSFYIFNLFKFFRELRHTKLFINGGGSLIQDATSSRSLYFYLFTLWAAKKMDCNVMMYGCGIGPVSKDANRRIAAKIINSCVDKITLRDAASKDELLRLGVSKPEILLSADPAISIPPCSDDKVNAALLSEGIPLDKKYFFISMRVWKQFDLSETFAKAAEYVYNKYGLIPVFLAAENPKDLPISEKTSQLANCPTYVIQNKYPADVIIGLLGKAEAVLAMRLHALIFAAAQGVPSIAVAYDVKVSGFMDYIENPLCVSLENADEAAILAMIDKAFANKQDRFAAKNKLLQKQSINTETAKNLL